MRQTVAIVFVGFMLTACACSEDKKINVVTDIAPVNGVMANAIHGWVTELVKLPAAEREEYLKRAAPHLERSVVYFLQRMGKIVRTDKVESVKIFFGSLDKVEAEDKNGVRHKGYAKDELVARVKIAGKEKPIDVFVRCLNGVFDLVDGQVAKLQQIGDYQNVAMRFTIGKGEGLVHHVDYQVAMDLAERFHLKLFRGKRQIENREITVAEARALEDRTDQVQVTVQVYEGDTFNLADDSMVR